ncbi:rpsB [Symbiodinium natans]|uniref:RpsB protein n=1 Tax=Symbiodinium natans TaxID=878477 RepID=A0A812PWA0_9DINO|nr:rpsB [Symbiodinium natans]
MQVRKPTRWAKPAAKGMKPMIHRKETRDVFKDGFEGWVANKDKNLDFMEKVVRQQLHGRFQFQFASQHFFDLAPLSSDMARRKRDFGTFMNHDYDDMFYVRKYLEPAKFKKLALGNWEMPELATKVVTMRELVDAGVQYGHKSNKWNPAMLKYLFADNDGTHIFDLVQTAANLNRACYYVMEAAARGAKFILVGTKEQARPIVRKYGQEAGIHYTDMKFVGGLVSNFPTIRKSVELMKKLREEKAQGRWNVGSEFQRFRNTCQLERLTRKYSGVEEMTSYPDICIFVDEAKERNPIAEMTRIGVPCIGMVDSNNEPKFVDIAIPSNTSNSKSIDLVIGKICEAIQKGQMFPEFSRDWHFQEFPKQWDPWIMSRVRCPEKKSMEGSLKLSLYVAMDVTCRHGRHLRMLALEGSDSLPPTSLKAAGLDEGLSRVYGLGYIGFRV